MTGDVVHIKGNLVVIEEDPVDDRAERGRVGVDVRCRPEHAMRNGKILRISACIAGEKSCARWIPRSLKKKKVNINQITNKITVIFRVNEDGNAYSIKRCLNISIRN